MTLLVGIPACARLVGEHIHHSTPARYGAALIGAAGAVPVLIPPVGEAALAILERLDGLLLSGSPSNVGPHLYGAARDQTPAQHDPARDGTTLPLIREALRRGMPVLGICRGIQEMNVALGGTLHQEVHLVDGREDHRGGAGSATERYRPKHAVTLTGGLARMLGQEALVNSVHGQALDRLGEGLAAEAAAPDGTVEGVRVTSATGWAFGVQWHPEWGYAEDAVSLALFRAFGEACRVYSLTLK